MNNYITKLAPALLALAVTIPTIASAQLSSSERRRAEELARIQAKADAAERSKERFSIRDTAKMKCQGAMRQWDYATDSCKPK